VVLSDREEFIEGVVMPRPPVPMEAKGSDDDDDVVADVMDVFGAGSEGDIGAGGEGLD